MYVYIVQHFQSPLCSNDVLFPFSLLQEKHLHCNGSWGSNTCSFGQLIVASKRKRGSKKEKLIVASNLLVWQDNTSQSENSKDTQNLWLL